MSGGRRLTRRTVSIGLGAGLSTLIAGQAIDIKVAAQARDLGGNAKTLSVLLPEGSRANLAPVAKAFTERTGVAVDLQEVHVDQINAELMLNSVLGEARYDVALPATFGLADLVAAGAVHALDGFAARYEPPGFREPMDFKRMATPI